jgi:hypothetical protein
LQFNFNVKPLTTTTTNMADEITTLPSLQEGLFVGSLAMSAEKDAKYGERIEVTETTVETTHSSIRGETDIVTSAGRHFALKYKLLQGIIWGVMNGYVYLVSVPIICATQ